jgi:cobalamin biosynthesis protein CobD/CbiB
MEIKAIWAEAHPLTKGFILLASLVVLLNVIPWISKIISGLILVLMVVVILISQCLSEAEADILNEHVQGVYKLLKQKLEAKREPDDD